MSGLGNFSITVLHPYIHSKYYRSSVQVFGRNIYNGEADVAKKYKTKMSGANICNKADFNLNNPFDDATNILYVAAGSRTDLQIKNFTF